MRAPSRVVEDFDGIRRRSHSRGWSFRVDRRLGKRRVRQRFLFGGEAVHVRILAGGISARRVCRLGGPLSALVTLVGCGGAVTTPVEGGSGSTLNSSAVDFENASSVFESVPNNELASAEPFEVDAEALVIRGEIDIVSDVDVFQIGAVETGDHVFVDVSVPDELKGVIALFDQDGSALLVNDHRNVYLGRKGPFIDLVVRRPSAAAYVGFSLTPGFQATGEYALLASIEPQAQIPNSRPESVILDFVGGLGVTIGSRAGIDVPPFDAATVAPRFEGQSDEVIRRVVQMIREDFAAFNVTIESTSDGDAYDGSQSRLYFGTFDPALLGVAEGVDEYNARPSQEAVVFTDTFNAFDALDPSVEEISQALANVASHEIGHLLGLVHTKNAVELMDVTASLSELMEDQAFGVSPIYEAVFPVGQQDAVQYLVDAVGGDESAARVAAQTAAQRAANKGPSREKRVPARTHDLLSSCDLPHR